MAATNILELLDQHDSLYLSPEQRSRLRSFGKTINFAVAHGAEDARIVANYCAADVKVTQKLYEEGS